MFTKGKSMRDYRSFIEERPEFEGLNRFCNICGYRFARFAYFNKIFPREAQCPICGSLERHRHLYVHLVSMYPFLKGKKILHFAPEYIIKDFFVNSEAEYIDVDLNSEHASYQADITQIPFPDNSFDYVIAIHVLEHIPDDIKAMKELYRVLKPQGTAILSVPMICGDFREDLTVTDPKERERLYGHNNHARFYNYEVFNERLQKANFNTEKVSDPKNFPQVLDGAIFTDYIFFAKKELK